MACADVVVSDDEYLQELGIPGFFAELQRQLCEERPAEPFEWVANRCRMKAVLRRAVARRAPSPVGDVDLLEEPHMDDIPRTTSQGAEEVDTSGEELHPRGSAGSPMYLPSGSACRLFESTPTVDRCQVSLNIAILIVGSRGDVQPFVAFGLGLKARGHRVRLATHVTFRSFVEGCGLEYFPLRGDPAQLMQFMVQHPTMITLSPKEIEENRRIMEEVYASTWVAVTTPEGYRPDVLISNPPVHVHIHLAEKLQIPLQIMFTMPWSPTSSYSHPLAPYGWTPLYGTKGTYAVVDEMIWVGMGSTINDFRKSTLGLPTVMRGGSLVQDAHIPHTYCMSQHLAQKPGDWGDEIDVVGFWFLDQKSSFDPQVAVPDLVAFLEASEVPPVYIGFGSIVVNNPEQLSKHVIEAIQAAGARAIVHQGWARLGAGLEVGPDIFLLDAAVPHDWLFTKCSVVCHHGGAGTTAAGLRCLRPTIIVPFFGDQPFWGSLVARMGVGPDPIPHKKLHKENLAAAIRFCQQPDVQRAAAELGGKIANENGVLDGVKAFERKLPLVGDVWTCEVWENQRWWVLKGWCGKLLPTDRPHFSDESGSLTCHQDDYVKPKGWEWESGWSVVKSDGTDSDGWQYRSDMPAALTSGKWHRKAHIKDCVRRRKWIRTRRPVRDAVGDPAPGPGAAVNSSIPVILYVTLQTAVGIGHGDCYCEISVRRGVTKGLQAQRSKVSGADPPVWNQTFYFLVLADDELVVRCYDWGIVRHPKGEGVVRVGSLPTPGDFRMMVKNEAVINLHVSL